MNTKIVIIGTAIISLLFVFLFLFLIKGRQSQLNNVLENNQPNLNTRVFKATEDDLTPEARQAVKEETYVFSILLRGIIISIDSANGIISLLAENQDQQGNKTETLTEVDFSKTETVLCWPENFPTTNGQQISLRNAFFSLQPGSSLFIENQTISDLSIVTDQIVGKYIFAHLTNTDFPTGTNPSIKELAILNCP